MHIWCPGSILVLSQPHFLKNVKWPRNWDLCFSIARDRFKKKKNWWKQSMNSKEKDLSLKQVWGTYSIGNYSSLTFAILGGFLPACCLHWASSFSFFAFCLFQEILTKIKGYKESADCERPPAGGSRLTHHGVNLQWKPRREMGSSLAYTLWFLSWPLLRNRRPNNFLDNVTVMCAEKNSNTRITPGFESPCL